jgi:hypothetical protein
MKSEIIQNQYDGPHAPAKRPGTGQISLDYINSDDAAEIDRGIRETIKGIQLSILAGGIGLAKMKERGLYVDLGYHSNAQYLESLCEQTHMARSSLHNWLYIGETYRKYQKELEKIGFSDEDGPTKLPYVERALALYQKKDVFKAVKDMSLREFISFSRGEEALAAPEESAIRVKGNQVYIGDRLAVTLDEGLDPKTRAYLADINAKAGQAIETGEVLYTTLLYDFDELRRFERGAERLKKEIRVKGKKIGKNERNR